MILGMAEVRARDIRYEENMRLEYLRAGIKNAVARKQLHKEAGMIGIQAINNIKSRRDRYGDVGGGLDKKLSDKDNFRNVAESGKA